MNDKLEGWSCYDEIKDNSGAEFPKDFEFPEQIKKQDMGIFYYEFKDSCEFCGDRPFNREGDYFLWCCEDCCEEYKRNNPNMSKFFHLHKVR